MQADEALSMRQLISSSEEQGRLLQVLVKEAKYLKLSAGFHLVGYPTVCENLW